MRQTLRWMVMVACLLASLSSTVVAQDKPGMMPGKAPGTMPGKAPGMPGGTATTAPAMTAPATPAAGLIDVNSATETDFTKLKGIGPVRAKAIVAYRQQNGPFKSLDDLEKVKGIGKKVLTQIKDQLVIR